MTCGGGRPASPVDVTRAAQEMNVPQSTLSRALVRLEEDLGVDLF
ncbi:helix-turn-helix domain-containing protein, partial [Streptomyces coelicoflavus]